MPRKDGERRFSKDNTVVTLRQNTIIMVSVPIVLRSGTNITQIISNIEKKNTLPLLPIFLNIELSIYLSTIFFNTFSQLSLGSIFLYSIIFSLAIDISTSLKKLLISHVSKSS